MAPVMTTCWRGHAVTGADLGVKAPIFQSSRWLFAPYNQPGDSLNHADAGGEEGARCPLADIGVARRCRMHVARVDIHVTVAGTGWCADRAGSGQDRRTRGAKRDEDCVRVANRGHGGLRCLLVLDHRGARSAVLAKCSEDDERRGRAGGAERLDCKLNFGLDLRRCENPRIIIAHSKSHNVRVVARRIRQALAQGVGVGGGRSQIPGATEARAPHIPDAEIIAHDPSPCVAGILARNSGAEGIAIAKHDHAKEIVRVGRENAFSRLNRYAKEGVTLAAFDCDLANGAAACAREVEFDRLPAASRDMGSGEADILPIDKEPPWNSILANDAKSDLRGISHELDAECGRIDALPCRIAPSVAATACSLRHVRHLDRRI